MFLGNESMDLQLTLVDSAQCFHWKRVGGGYGAVIDGAPVVLRAEADGLHARGEADVRALRHYLDLDRNYAAVAEEYAHISQAKRAMELYSGLRVLNQPTWEALVAFILSANNNVPRITHLVDALSRELGAPCACEGTTLYGFPTPQALADCDEARLRKLGVGYRAPYLIQTARAVADGFPLEDLRRMAYPEAHRLLTTLAGVGDKVADCVLLFGCGQSSAFPVDVWVERLLDKWFHIPCGNRRQMMCAARALLGAHAGLVQQFLFHAARMGDIEL